jgi:hypothetical protein
MSQAIAILAAGRPSWLAAMRTRRLATRRARARAASGIEHAIHAAERPPQSLSSAVPVARVAVLGSRVRLLSLAERLRSPEPVYAQGVARALELLTQGDSPLYQVDGDLDTAVEDILAALDGRVE